MPDGQMPPDPMAGAHEGYVAMHVLYLSLRRAGWGVLAAAAFTAARLCFAEPDPDAGGSG